MELITTQALHAIGKKKLIKRLFEIILSCFPQPVHVFQLAIFATGFEDIYDITRNPEIFHPPGLENSTVALRCRKQLAWLLEK